MSRLIVLLALSGVLIIVPPTTVGQASSDSLYLTLGEPMERLVAGSDTTQHYALYLPSTFSRARPSPVLLMMDPRGRAMVPLTLFRVAAERHGYVVMSSYNTLSDADTAYAANDRALTAMLIDAQVRIGVDPARFYLVGFSGTAHYAWAVAAQLDGHLAGIVGVGSGLTAHDQSIQNAARMERPPAYFGTAGFGDFNFDGARMLDAALDTTALPHRFVTHDGGHEWPPPSVAASAVDWLQAQAMRAGLTPHDGAFIDSLRTVSLAEARALEGEDQKADALRRYREVAADFEGLGGAPEAVRRLEDLGQDPEVRQALEHRAALARQVFTYGRTVRRFTDAYRNAETPPSHERALRRLHIPSLRRQADDADRERAGAARRMLAVAYVNMAFYEPRTYFEQQEYARAAGLLRIARSIRPEASTPCYWLGRAEAQLGHEEEALDALACAIDGGGVSVSQLEGDALLDPLRADARFQDLVDRTRAEPRKP